MRSTVFLLCAATLSYTASAAPTCEDKGQLLVFQNAAGTLQRVTTSQDWEQRRAHILENMQRVMGPLPGEERRVAPDMQVVEEVRGPGYVRQTISFAVESWDRLPAYLYVPNNATDCPAMVCLHPTSSLGKGVVAGLGEKPNRAYAEELARRGYVTLAPDYPGFGDYVAARKALYERGYTSCTMKGIWNHMRCVDLLQSLPFVDGARIGCIGHSLGGHNTLFLGVFDTRVRVLVTSCGFTSFPKYMAGDLTGWTHDGYMPSIASEFGKEPARMPFDFTEVLGALAPRTVFVNAPLHDANFDVSGVRDCIAAAQPVFALLGAADKLQAVFPDAEHDFPDAAREAAYAAIDSALRK